MFVCRWNLDIESPRPQKDRCVRDVVLKKIAPNFLHRTPHKPIYPQRAQNQDRLSTICTQRVLKFFGHTVRREVDSLERLLVTGHVERTRGKGRAPSRWTQTLSQMPHTPPCREQSTWRRIGEFGVGWWWTQPNIVTSLSHEATTKNNEIRRKF